MRKKYNKPTYRVKNLEQRLLTTESVPWGGTGSLDAKGCAFEAEEDTYDFNQR